MTIQDAEGIKQNLEMVLNQACTEGLTNMEIFVAPANEQDFQSFRKMWRNSTYVSALATYGSVDMTVYVCDEKFSENNDQFEPLEEFLNRTGITL